MSFISKIRTPSNTVYEFKYGVYPVSGTQTSATHVWTGNIDVSSLYDGLTIAYYLPYAGTTTEATLNLTLNNNQRTGAIPVYYTGTTANTTTYEAGSTIILTYWSAGSISISGTPTSTASWRRADCNINSSYMEKGVDYVTAGKDTYAVLGQRSTAEGYETDASGDYAHAEGYETIAYGEASHAEGSGGNATGLYSHAEGYNTVVQGDYAHGEGMSSSASGEGAHAEGGNTEASGDYSHAEGYETQANGVYSHTEGQGTIASSAVQHVFGQYNEEDASGNYDSQGEYVEIVGNGTNDNIRSNARTLDWDGNEVLAGKLTVGANPTNNMDVATKQYVDTSISNKQSKPTITSTALLANGWSNSSYAGLQTTYPIASYDIEIEPNGDTITDAQLSAWNDAQILGSVTTNTLKAAGTVPTVDIPIMVKIWAK